ncbi:maleylpyruvate isomerase family mycothiol-dependent enzyme [Kutzneria viridogrisea]|uniref:Uncharacterized protein (TIGR03083 family) n=1 Tax=Kutzneria viridogrisea TaxID=47990 RepID=A0ABR6BPX1_9PSEU|nr:uncharacterized protein (TIGR03083 family) [Kutzneria viridogrisea]
MDTWRLIATERARLVDGLAGVTEAEWDSPSLCAGWLARDVLAHLVSTAEMTPRRFVFGLLRHGLAFHRMTAADAARYGERPVPALLERLAGLATSHDHPPGPIETLLLEAVVHGEDILFPLGLTADHVPEALVRAADFARTAQPLVGCRRRIAGLRLQATDCDWQTGSGPEVLGPLRSVLLAMCGRKAALASLNGPGVTALEARP